MSTSLVSVVLPTYNRAWCLPRAIRSVLAQTHQELELIVVDDGSTDGTAELVARIGDPRLRYLAAGARGGVSRARNLGIEAARGDWVAFQDSDDEWRVEKLEKQLAAAADAVLVLCGDIFVNELSMSYLGTGGTPVVSADRLVLFRIPGAPCWLARRDALLAAGGFDAGLDCFEDWELALRLSERGRLRLVNEPLVLAQKTPGSLFSTESAFAPNLKRIVERHGARLRADPVAWNFYCNLIGQSECQYGSPAEGRRWFVRALAARPGSPRAWANLLASVAGRRVFRRYVRAARAVRRRWSPLAALPAVTE